MYNVPFFIVFFTKTLSQKVRSIRLFKKRKSHSLVSPAQRVNNSPKFKTVPSGSSLDMLETDEHYEEQVLKLTKKSIKKQPDHFHMKQLVKMT